MSPLKLILIAAVLRAGPSATLTGQVTNTGGITLQGVEVQAINVETGLKFSTETSDEGLYSITNLPPGVYRLQLLKHGFVTIIKPGLELRVQDIIALNFQMQIGSTSESITEREGAPQLQGETATVGQTVDRNMLTELPTLFRRTYFSVTASPGSGVFAREPTPVGHTYGAGLGFVVNGQRPESGSFLIDGADSNSNPANTSPAQMLPYEAVREYRILTNAFTAEYGRNTGFISNLVTKSGTNEFHGSLFNYIHNSALAANSFDRNARGQEKDLANHIELGGSVGGPIVPDRAFFFASLESILVRHTVFRGFTVPTRELLAI